MFPSDSLKCRISRYEKTIRSRLFFLDTADVVGGFDRSVDNSSPSRPRCAFEIAGVETRSGNRGLDRHRLRTFLANYGLDGQEAKPERQRKVGRVNFKQEPVDGCFTSSRLSHEAVPHAPDGQNVTRIGGVRFDISAETEHKIVDRPCRQFRRLIPDIFQNL